MCGQFTGGGVCGGWVGFGVGQDFPSSTVVPSSQRLTGGSFDRVGELSGCAVALGDGAARVEVATGMRVAAAVEGKVAEGTLTGTRPVG
jgi:hypothetical protein